VDLEEDLDFWKLFVDLHPDSVDDNADGGLGHPSDGFWDDAIQSVKDVPAIAKSVLNETGLVNLTLNSIMPLLDTRMRTEPKGLSAFNFSNRPSGISSHSAWLAAVVGSMAKYLGEFAE
jgi:hypothetical protein